MNLRDRLRSAMDPRRTFHAQVWGAPKAMSSALREVRKAFGEEVNDVPQDSVLQEALQQFAATRKVASFTELKYVCHGLTTPFGSAGDSLLKRNDLLPSLLKSVDVCRPSPKQFRRCYQGLLGGYFGFDLYSDGLNKSAKGNWLALRGFLDGRLDEVMDGVRARSAPTPWVATLAEHRNLLSDQPCERYAAALRAGKHEDLQQVCSGLGIASSSWVWSEALMAYVRQVVGFPDDKAFKQEFEGILKLVTDNGNLKLPRMLAIEALAQTVVRYRRCEDRSEHAWLRDTCIRLIGNPWVEQVAWSAHVNDEPARQMVESWLKRGLIKDFFNLLAHDGGADTRRLEYWLKWEPKISDMWFVLGADARNNRTSAFVSLRERMKGRYRELGDVNPANNAFVMCIGPLLVIEFGVTGNACYVFAATDFDTDLNRQTLKLYELKQRRAVAERLSHSGNWEPKFDHLIGDLLKKTPQHKGLQSRREVLVQQSAVKRRVTPIQQPLAPAPTTLSPAKAQALAKALFPSPPASSSVAAISAPPALDPGVKRFWPSYTPPQAVERSGPSSTAPLSPPVARHDSNNRPKSDADRAAADGQTGAKEASSTNSDPVISAVKLSCEKYGVMCEDNRHKGGAFWVLMPDRRHRLGFSMLLESQGFKYAEGKGFWIKKD